MHQPSSSSSARPRCQGEPARTLASSPGRGVFSLWRRLLLVFGLLAAFTGPASAQILSTYCDGNPADWANFQDPASPNYKPIRAYSLDVANAASNLDNQFTNGSKDGDALASWRWSLGNANAKGDITNAGAALTGTNNCVLRFFGDRTSDNGDASIGFWFFVSPVSVNGDGTFSGTHTNGDILIISDFTSGGTQPTIKVYEWLSGSLVLQSASTARCADVNHETRPVPAGFSYTASNGSTSYAPNLFFEGAIDLCALNISTCFAAFLVETRNSQSITASLQDFTSGSFNATPGTPAATVVPPTCTTATGTVNVTNPVAGYTYTLTGTSPVRAAVTSATGVFSLVLPGTYSLTARQGTCVSGASAVTVPPQPVTPGTPAATVVPPTCTTATGTVNVTNPVAGYTYTLTGTSPVRAAVSNSTGIFTVVQPGTYSLTATLGSCPSPAASVIVPPQPTNPARPVVTIQEATLCGTLTAPTLTVSCPVSGITYTLTQTGVTGSQTRLYNGTGTVVFTVQAGKRFSVTATSSGGCVSAATDCDNYTSNSCPAPRPDTGSSLTPGLQQNIQTEAFPNPTGRDATINFTVPQSGHAVLDVYNAMGLRVATLYNGPAEAGATYSVVLKGSTLPSGTYFYKVSANGQVKTNRISVVK